MLRDTLIRLSNSTRARRFVTSAPGARTMARRFVAGETVDDGVNATRVLNRNGAAVSLDYLGESVSSREDARAVRARNLDRLNLGIGHRTPGIDRTRIPAIAGASIGIAVITVGGRSIRCAARGFRKHLRVDADGAEAREG